MLRTEIDVTLAGAVENGGSGRARRYENVIAASNKFARPDFAVLFALFRRMKPSAAKIFAEPATLKIGHESRRTFNDLTGMRGEGFGNRCAAGISLTGALQILFEAPAAPRKF